MVGFRPVRVGSELKYKRFIHEGWSSVYCFTGTDNVHAEETWGLFSQLKARQKKMTLFNDCMRKIMRSLADAGSAVSWLNGVGKDVWTWFSISVIYCRKIPDRNDMSCAKHGVAVRRPILRVLVSIDEIFDLWKSKERHLKETMYAKWETSWLMARAERLDMR